MNCSAAITQFQLLLEKRFQGATVMPRACPCFVSPRASSGLNHERTPEMRSFLICLGTCQGRRASYNRALHTDSPIKLRRSLMTNDPHNTAGSSLSHL